MLNAYARAETPFDRMGRRTVAVQVARVARTGQSTFELRWEEHIFEHAVTIRRERYGGGLLRARPPGCIRAGQQESARPLR